jgi:hypothetical protein
MPLIGSIAGASISGYGGRGASSVGGSVAFGSLRDFGIAAVTGSVGPPTAGGTLTINGQSLGSYDYTIVRGPTTVSAFTATDWFTTTEDTRSACIFVDGNLTINAGQTFIPSVRKLFTFIYVKGNLILNGSISMSARGANHSGTGTSGGFTAAQDIRIATGTYSGVTNPIIPASGGAGGAGGAGYGGGAGGAGSSGGTGGGSGGNGIYGRGGNGSAGTCFSGGAGGGGCGDDGYNGEAGGINGGKGGAAFSNTGKYTGGGAGNPGGAKAGAGGQVGANGAGGTVIIIVTGTFSGSGSVTSAGAKGGNGGNGGFDGVGGGSGGGSVNVLYGTDSSTVTLSATGGLPGTAGGSPASERPSAAAGNGTTRKLAL